MNSSLVRVRFKLIVRYILLLFLFSIFTDVVLATHNRAGEIIYTKLPGTSNRFKFKIITYTEIGNNNADRPELGIDFGDSQSDSIKRTAKGTFPDYPNIQWNEYETEHTYPGPGNYIIRVEDPNRNGGVINIPNSINTVFYIESELNIVGGIDNNSPALRYPPIDFACVNSPFYHNPGASDLDGDSLVYTLEPCRSDSGKIIPGYSFPVATQTFGIDSFTGTLTWDSPNISGEFNIAIRITEWRRITTPNGKKVALKIGSVLRDMQITVEPGCSNRPPEFEDLLDYCVVVGDTLSFTVIGTDVNDNSTQSGSAVFIEVEGAPFELDPKAVYNPRYNEPIKDPVFLDIFWTPACSQVRKRPYDLFFKIYDNGYRPLSNFGTSTIRVIAPAVPNFQAEALASAINLSWDSPLCLEATGYKIYRKEGSSGFIPDSCETGVPEYLGFTLIKTVESLDQVTFLDDNDGRGLIPGEVYCYLIISVFKDGAESIASEEVCAQLKKDVPILTNVSVLTTNTENGSIYTAWSKPTEFDPLVYPGPYRYRIYRTENRKLLQFKMIDSLNSIDDTIYTDLNLNTSEVEYAYRIEILDLSESASRSMGFSVVGTSIFLSSKPKDNRLILNWNEAVPWKNRQYVIYKQNNSGQFNVLDTITENEFNDSNLTNLKEYCYYVMSIGEYSLKSIAHPLMNSSQIHCNTPVDFEAPCAPDLTLEAEDCANILKMLMEDPSLCGRGIYSENQIDKVELNWTNKPQSDSCDPTDIVRYELFYSPIKNGSFELIAKLEKDERSFVHLLNNTRAGCYYITAIDSVPFENVSIVTDTICVDNCILYQLPNVITLNGDGINDVLEPFPFCFVESVDLKVFNRWGTIVFETSDPLVKWDGRDRNTGNLVADGVYFYSCKVNQISVEGIKPVELKGNVHVLGTSNSSSE